MKSITLGLALGLLGGVALNGAAMAQTPPPSPPPALKQPAPGPTPTPPAPNAPQAQQQGAPAAPPAPPPQQNAQNGQPPIPTPSGPPEGMIVETPNGFYLVRPGDPNPQRLDLGRPGGGGQGGMGHAMMGQNGQPGMNGDEDIPGDMADEGLPPPPPPHRRGPPPHPPEGKGARVQIHSPNLDLNVKCPEDAPLKACFDAIAELMDKANAQAH